MSTPKSVYQIKVTLIGSKPPIWRRFLVPDTTTLYRLHDILQIVMGWQDYHLHMFTINGQIYGDPEDDENGDLGTKNEARFKLNQALGREGSKFRYEYDFGDSWEHELIVEKILPAEKGIRYPLCVAGKRACPPEDVGGVWGYQKFLEAIGDPEHPEHDEYQEWTGGEFDPEHFDLDEVNDRLRHPRRGREADDYLLPKLEDRVLDRITAWSQGLSNDETSPGKAERRDLPHPRVRPGSATRICEQTFPYIQLAPCLPLLCRRRQDGCESFPSSCLRHLHEAHTAHLHANRYPTT